MFFIVLAAKKHENIVHVKCVIIANVSAILLVCGIVTTQFVFLPAWVIYIVVSVICQIITRIEIEALAHIVQLAVEQIPTPRS
jgi:ABC-type multidrug transport system permease subunit